MADLDEVVGLFDPNELRVEPKPNGPPPAPLPPAPPLPVIQVPDARLYVAEQLGHALRLHAGLGQATRFLDTSRLDADQAEAVRIAGSLAIDAARTLYLALARLTNAFGLPDDGASG